MIKTVNTEHIDVKNYVNVSRKQLHEEQYFINTSKRNSSPPPTGKYNSSLKSIPKPPRNSSKLHATLQDGLYYGEHLSSSDNVNSRFRKPRNQSKQSTHSS